MEPSLPARFGRYVLLDRIDVGGMAEVFSAVVRGEGGFSKRVAIKRIHQHLLKPEYIELFKKEAQIAALLQHPNLVEVYDFDRVDDAYFLAMQWVEGVTLESVIRKLLRQRQPLDVSLAVFITSEVAAGLAYAHDFVGTDGQPQPVVHRDVTPSNMLLDYSGGVKLTDFGVAELAGQAQDRGGRVRGKISYMAPEMLDGDPASAKSDLYSLGVVLYEILTMRRLFKRTSDLEMISLIKTQDIPPPSAINPRVSAQLDALVMKALARNPEARFVSADHFRQALLVYLDQDKRAALGRLLDSLFYKERATRRERLQAALDRAVSIETPNVLESAPTEEASRHETDPGASVGDMFADLAEQQLGTLLVVDDTDDVRAIMTRILKRVGHDVISAASGAEALAVLETFPVDLVLLDVNMPKMSGFDVLHKLRGTMSRVELPVIMVTARDSTEDIVKGLSIGANDYVTKPIDFGVLEARIRSQLWLRKAFDVMNRSNEFYRAIVESATEVVLQMSRAATLIYVSPSSWRLLGRSTKDLQGTDFLELVAPEDRKNVAKVLEEMQATSGPARIEHRVRMAGNIMVPAVTTLQPAMDASSKAWVGFRGSLRVED